MTYHPTSGRRGFNSGLMMSPPSSTRKQLPSNAQGVGSMCGVDGWTRVDVLGEPWDTTGVVDTVYMGSFSKEITRDGHGTEKLVVLLQ